MKVGKLGKHDKPEPDGFPVGEPPGKRDGSPQRPGKHQKPPPSQKPTPKQK